MILLQIAMRQARPRAESAAVALSHQIDDRVPFVQVDRARVLSACCKLLENAIQGTPRGGRVLCEVRWTGEHVLFSCHDSGPPMSEELIPHVFDGLWQPGPTELRGAGLALPMVKAVIEVHGGSVWAGRKPPGTGSSLFPADPDSFGAVHDWRDILPTLKFEAGIPAPRLIGVGRILGVASHYICTVSMVEKALV